MNNEVKKEKKSVLNTLLSFILSFFAILAVVFTNLFSYANGAIFGAQNSDIVNQLIEDEIGSKKESIKRQADSSVVEPNIQSVPNSGFVNNIYLNIFMPVSEVYETIINADLSFINLGGTYSGYLVSLDENYNGLIVLYVEYPDSDSLIGLTYGSVFSIDTLPAYFLSTGTGGEWSEHVPVNGIIDVDSTLLSELIIPAGEMGNPENITIPVGLENEKLKTVLSITPFNEQQEQASIFEKFLSDASDIILGFITILSTAAISLSDVFIDSSTNKLTIVGSAMVLALAVGVIYLLFRMVRGLIKSNIRG